MCPEQEGQFGTLRLLSDPRVKGPSPGSQPSSPWRYEGPSGWGRLAVQLPRPEPALWGMPHTSGEVLLREEAAAPAGSISLGRCPSNNRLLGHVSSAPRRNVLGPLRNQNGHVEPLELVLDFFRVSTYFLFSPVCMLLVRRGFLVHPGNCGFWGGRHDDDTPGICPGSATCWTLQCPEGQVKHFFLGLGPSPYMGLFAPSCLGPKCSFLATPGRGGTGHSR